MKLFTICFIASLVLFIAKSLFLPTITMSTVFFPLLLWAGLVVLALIGMFCLFLLNIIINDGTP